MRHGSASQPNVSALRRFPSSFRCVQVVDLVVEAISPEGITLRSQGREAAYLPVAHLSDYAELCEPLLLQHQLRLEAAVARGEQYVLRDLLVVCHKLPIRHTVRHTLCTNIAQ